jgi:flavin-dependent dehydrogenase
MARIAIVGGGPAGSALALSLIERGVDPSDLTIFDKAKFPRPKLCGGALTFRGTEALEALIGRPPGGLQTLAIAFRSKFGEVEIHERGVQWVYDRALLDEALLRAAQRAGVHVREGSLISGLEPASRGWRVKSGDAVESFDWVAGADGACGIVRRAADLRGGTVGRLVEAIFEPTDATLDRSLLHFDFDPVTDGIPGYAWIFPYPGAELCKIGIMDACGRVPGSELRRWTARFAERRGFRLVDDKIAGWPERYADRSTRGHRPGLVLVGEAWGIDRLLGEGIAPALHHAIYAAMRIKWALDAGDDRIDDYDAGFWASIEGRNLRFQGHLADRIYGSRGAHWMRILFDLPRLRELAEAGQDSYGRLARHIPSLIGSYLWYSMTHSPFATSP